MHKRMIAGASVLTFLLAACGGSEQPEVVEQIKVREPGEASAANSSPSAEPGASTDVVAAGEAAFAVCSGCHVAEKGAASMAGPNLHGVFGRKAGALDDFAYSDALAGSDITWDIESLDRFLSNPNGYVPGTSMAAGAVRDVETRAAIVAYLRSLSE